MKVVKITIYEGITEVTDVPTGVEVHIKNFINDMTEPPEDAEILVDAEYTDGSKLEYWMENYWAGEDEVVQQD